LIAVIGAVIGTLFLVYRRRTQDCLAAARTETDAIVVLVCEREYLRTGDPWVGAQLADAQRRSKNLAVASAIAHGLLVTPARAEAFRVLGRIATTERRLDAAMSLLETARDLHRAAGHRAGLAKDDQAIAGILQSRHQFAQALRTLDECITEADAAEDQIIEGYCHLSAAFVLLKAGSFEAAQQELDRAEPLLTLRRDYANFATQQGNLYQELRRRPVGDGYHERAISMFKDALASAERAQLPDLVLSIKLNLAASLAEVHRIDAAERYLAEAKILDADNIYAIDRTQIQARIAYRRGDLALASSLNDRIYPKITDDDDRIAVCAMQAQIALASDDLVRAAQWARRGIASAEQIRAAQPDIELRAWVLSTRREPYELLFTALARAGRVDEAVAVFDQWQGRSLLDALSKPLPAAPLDLRGAASRLENFGKWLPAVSNAPLMMQSLGRPVIEAVRSIDLLALAVADHHLWRITAAGGQVQLDDLGLFEALKERIDRFTVAPTDGALADELGQLLLRDTIVRTTPEALRVVLDGPLATLPVAALRRHGKPLIAVRPIIRASRVSEVACAARPTQPGTAIILADAGGDGAAGAALPEARAGARSIAALLGTTSSVGAAATSTALYAAKRNDVLHVAVHADIDAEGSYLALYDQKVHALDISARKLGPALVVLAACASALSNDLELAGSLVTAFLAGGSTQVMATLRPISDRGAHELTTRFYREGGANAPVRVLARLQASLAGTDNPDWPFFAVFGHDLCNSSSNL
jgi:pentatricopeptide repeat protein